jgi:hypothetical protein
MKSERYRRVSLNVSRDTRNVHNEHRAIYDAAMQRNTLRACRMIELHLSRTAEEVRKAMTMLVSEAGGDCCHRRCEIDPAGNLNLTRRMRWFLREGGADAEGGGADGVDCLKEAWREHPGPVAIDGPVNRHPELDPFRH